MIELYEFPLSGNCHKVRLMLGLLGIEYTSKVLNSAEGEHKSPEFIAMNPFGQTPVLKDGDTMVRDSQAILVYLAKKYGGTQWWPEDAVSLSSIAAWLSTAANEIARGPNSLRLHHKFGRVINEEDAQQVTQSIFNILNTHLSTHTWLATDNLSIADIAIYPYIALSPEGKVDLTRYPQVVAWTQRIQAIPGYVSMPGM